MRLTKLAGILAVSTKRAFRPAPAPPDAPLPERSKRTTAAASGAAALASFLGDAPGDCAPAALLHALCFEPTVDLLSDPAVPVPVAGLVVSDQRWELAEPVAIGSAVTVDVQLASIVRDSSSTSLFVRARIRCADRPVYREVTEYVARKAGGEAYEVGRTPRIEVLDHRRAYGTNASGRLDIGQNAAVSSRVFRVADSRRWARITGDANPIHTSSLAAKAFGYRKAVLHGAAVDAWMAHEAGLDGAAPCSGGTHFRAPALLPAHCELVRLGAEDFAVVDRDSGRDLVHARLTGVPDGRGSERGLVLPRDDGRPSSTFLGRGMAAAAAARVREISERFGFDVDPAARIEDLPVGVQQRVEIIKALAREARVLILDEPTAVLTPQETDELMGIMRDLRAAGTSIVFITHKLREVREVADTITVIRRGAVVGTADPSAPAGELAGLMVGHDVSLSVDKAPARPSGAGLVLEGVSLVADGAVLLDDISLEVASGEILGVAGVQGNGQTELGEVVLGLTRPTAGSIRFGERDVTRLGVHRRLGAGLGFVPEDRSTSGMIADFSVAENMILDRYDDPAFGTGPALSPAKIRANAQRLREEFDVRVTDVADPISTLSGGNQQKAILARELSRDLRVLVACQPTRGLDVGSIEFVHGRIVAERDDNGTAVLIISSELDEIYSLSDRIAVMYRGRIVGVVGPDTPRDVLGLMMAGIPGDEALARRDDADAPSTSATSTEESR